MIYIVLRSATNPGDLQTLKQWFQNQDNVTVHVDLLKKFQSRQIVHHSQNDSELFFEENNPCVKPIAEIIVSEVQTPRMNWDCAEIGM